MDRNKRIRVVQDKLGNRPLVWFGPRGTDATGLNVFTDNFAGCFTFYDRFPYSWNDKDTCNFVALEDFTKRRKLSRAFGQDDLTSRGEFAFVRRFQECLGSAEPFVMAYEAHPVLDAAVIKAPNATLLGNDLHTFERTSMKPRIEKDLKKAGVPIIPWEILNNIDQVDPYFDTHEAVVVRPHSGSSGAGILRFEAGEFSDDARAEVRALLIQPHSVVSIAPYLPNAVSLNMSGVVYPKHSVNKPCNVSRFPCSSQLIGIPSLTDLPFGYCGNDFAYGMSLDDNVLDECDRITRLVGEYLGSQGYIGSFGVDLLMTQDGEILFTEVNPRFQGSTRMLSRICSKANQPDVLVEHLAATLGIKFAGTPTAQEWAEMATPWSQMYLHSQSRSAITAQYVNGKLPYMTEATEISSTNTPANTNVLEEMVAKPDVSIEFGSVLERISVRGAATLDARVLTQRAQSLVNAAMNQYVHVKRPAISQGRSSADHHS